MINIPPHIAIEKGYVLNVGQGQIQQVGIDLRIAKEVVIPSMSFVNVPFMESFNLTDVFGLVIIRSSLSRRGVFSSSGVYDPGFTGTGGVSLYNFGPVITLPKKFRVAQIVLFPAAYSSLYQGTYNQQNNIESKLGG